MAIVDKERPASAVFRPERRKPRVDPDEVFGARLRGRSFQNGEIKGSTPMPMAPGLMATTIRSNADF